MKLNWQCVDYGQFCGGIERWEIKYEDLTLNIVQMPNEGTCQYRIYFLNSNNRLDNNWDITEYKTFELCEEAALDYLQKLKNSLNQI